MKRFYLLTVVFSLVFTVQSISQTWEQFIPVEIRQALKNGTRTLVGEPGEYYWQNHSDYVIEATLDTKKSMLSGHEKIVHYNESPDTLDYLFFRLYQNYYKKGSARSWKIDSSDLTNGVRYSNIRITYSGNDSNQFEKTGETPTNMTVSLKQPLLPGQTAVIEMDWDVHIPKISRNRMGNYGNDDFFIAYWYPQVAVYDDIDGWDRVEFYGTTEFYNDFNNYDIKITVPPGFKVWATGELQNTEDIYTKKVIKKIEEAGNSDDVLSIFTADDCRKEKVLKNNEEPNTFHFKAGNVPDFSFGVAKNVNWQGSSVVVDRKTGRKTFTDAVYPDSLRTFDSVAYYTRWSVQFMSEHVPGVPFPYPHMTCWSNGTKRGGMETPMMANNGDAHSYASAAGLSFHEISHTYFPFYMGTNERKYAWMDEGWANYMTRFVYDSLSPDYNYFSRVVSGFESINGKEKEVPLSDLSYQITNWRAYRIHAYNRPSVAYNYLREALGDSLFFKGLHFYMEQWHGKHPAPFDFFTAFEAATGRDLKWYYKPWFLQRCSADLGLVEVEGDHIIVENAGGIPVPVQLTLTYDDGSKKTIYKKVTVWENGDSKLKIKYPTDKKLKEVMLGSDLIPDIDESNNEIRF
jgi:hypothetical protein